MGTGGPVIKSLSLARGRCLPTRVKSGCPPGPCTSGSKNAICMATGFCKCLCAKVSAAGAGGGEPGCPPEAPSGGGEQAEATEVTGARVSRCVPISPSERTQEQGRAARAGSADRRRPAWECRAEESQRTSADRGLPAPGPSVTRLLGPSRTIPPPETTPSPLLGPPGLSGAGRDPVSRAAFHPPF